MDRRVLLLALAVGTLTAATIIFFTLSQPSEPVDTIAEDAAVTTPRATPRAPAAPAPDRSGEPSARRIDPGPAPEPSEPATPSEPAPAADLGHLRIDADVPNAQVFLDRQFIGAAPITAENIAPGTHQLNVSADGFESIAMPVEVVAGQRELMIRFREVRLESAIEVVHRHGVGSCRGKLIATPGGMRFETPNKGDAFTTPLQTLETFEVDYLEKNLRVKLPKGRQFNFTDPEGNADRLFVFHRDVEKARDRLKRGDMPATN